MIDKLTAMRMFVRAGRMGNFSSAGRELGLSQPSASRLIAALENEIGVTLFSRTTRAVSLTEAGLMYMLRVEAILSSLDEADHEARGTDELRGVLRVGAPSSFALRKVIPCLPEFLEANPSLRLELLMHDGHQDLVRDGIDVAFCFGQLQDSSAIARKVWDAPRILAASPTYLAQHGVPTSPSDLAHHAVISDSSGFSPTLSFEKDGRVASVQVDSPLRLSINEAAIASAVAGLGIVASCLGIASEEIECGTLVRILPDWDLGLMALHSLFASRRFIKPAARALVNFLTKRSNPSTSASQFAYRCQHAGTGPTANRRALPD
jgi:DNA-binding transcriptional LysR family regulator